MFAAFTLPLVKTLVTTLPLLSTTSTGGMPTVIPPNALNELDAIIISFNNIFI